ncbi:unnamed protein product [Onchocerca flexuosa]|uniref:Secretory carrier-associated membrane protein n=1 Tax=Onchocerca flexuosa TaxID=387005 RepID=A0A183HNV0_9BILA|nr:unnamed protein product [Onchocerca flexuosa]
MSLPLFFTLFSVVGLLVYWFLLLYRNDSSFNFMLFFVVLFFHSIFTLVQALGLSQYACGWINAINTFHHSIFASLIMIVSAIAFTAAFVGMVFALFRVHRFYRGAGFSLDKARKEFSDGVMTDRNVQQVLSGLHLINAFLLADASIKTLIQHREFSPVF